MSDSNRTKVGICDEASYGAQTANPAFINLPYITGSGLTFDPVVVESKALRADRMVGDTSVVGKNGGGTLPMEVAYASLDPILPYQLMSGWVRTPVRYNNGTADSEITDVTVTTGVYTILTTGSGNTDAHFGAFKVGHLVRASGFTNAGNNGLYRASAASATSVTLGNTSTAETAPPATARLKVVGFRGASGDITAAAGGLGSTALDFTTLGLAVGQWIKIGGSAAGEQFATAALNGWARITAIAATVLSLDNLPTGWTTDTGTAKTITVWLGDYIRNGTTKQSMTIEEQYQDLDIPEYNYYDGMLADQLALSIKNQEIVKAVLTLMGQDVTNGAARAAGATDVAGPTNDVLNASSNVGQIAEGGTAYTGTTAITSADLVLKNGKRRRGGVGSQTNQADASGAFRCEVSLAMYYANNTIRTKILAGTASSFSTRLQDTTAPNNSRAIIIDIPRLKYTGGNPNVPGIDTDRTIDPKFVSLYSSTFGYAFHWQRFEEVYF